MTMKVHKPISTLPPTLKRGGGRHSKYAHLSDKVNSSTWLPIEFPTVSEAKTGKLSIYGYFRRHDLGNIETKTHTNGLIVYFRLAVTSPKKSATKKGK
jgi:hypothetical protein